MHECVAKWWLVFDVPRKSHVIIIIVIIIIMISIGGVLAIIPYWTIHNLLMAKCIPPLWSGSLDTINQTQFLAIKLIYSCWYFLCLSFTSTFASDHYFDQWHSVTKRDLWQSQFASVGHDDILVIDLSLTYRKILIDITTNGTRLFFSKTMIIPGCKIS